MCAHNEHRWRLNCHLNYSEKFWYAPRVVDDNHIFVRYSIRNREITNLLNGTYSYWLKFIRMRHRKAFRKLNRTSSHRWAMLRNMVTQLITHERIKTTVPKAKELRRVADSMVTLAKVSVLNIIFDCAIAFNINFCWARRRSVKVVQPIWFQNYLKPLHFVAGLLTSQKASNVGSPWKSSSA